MKKIFEDIDWMVVIVGVFCMIISMYHFDFDFAPKYLFIYGCAFSVVGVTFNLHKLF